MYLIYVLNMYISYSTIFGWTNPLSFSSNILYFILFQLYLTYMLFCNSFNNNKPGKLQLEYNAQVIRT